MVAESLITARVTSEMKERFAAVARYQALSESALLKRLVEAALVTVTAVKPQVTQAVEPVPVGGKISVRLRNDDLLLLRERAKARAMPTERRRDQCHRSEPEPNCSCSEPWRGTERCEQGGSASAATRTQRHACPHQVPNQLESRELAER